MLEKNAKTIDLSYAKGPNREIGRTNEVIIGAGVINEPNF